MPSVWDQKEGLQWKTVHRTLQYTVLMEVVISTGASSATRFLPECGNLSKVYKNVSLKIGESFVWVGRTRVPAFLRLPVGAGYVPSLTYTDKLLK